VSHGMSEVLSKKVIASWGMSEVLSLLHSGLQRSFLTSELIRSGACFYFKNIIVYISWSHFIVLSYIFNLDLCEYIQFILYISWSI
jgi:hypothetical protein